MTFSDDLIRTAEWLHTFILRARRAVYVESNYRRYPTHLRIHPGDYAIITEAAAEVGADVPPGSKLWSLIVEVDSSVEDPIVEARA